jgi:hypothetical protein
LYEVDSWELYEVDRWELHKVEHQELYEVGHWDLGRKLCKTAFSVPAANAVKVRSGKQMSHL